MIHFASLLLPLLLAVSTRALNENSPLGLLSAGSYVSGNAATHPPRLDEFILCLSTATSAQFELRPGRFQRPLPTNSSIDYWRVDVLSQDGAIPALRSTPRVVADVLRGVYTFTVALPPLSLQASLKLEVFLQQEDFSFNALASRTCTTARTAATLRYTAVITADRQPCAGTARLRRTSSAQCAPAEFDSLGWYSCTSYRLFTGAIVAPEMLPKPVVGGRARRLLGGARMLKRRGSRKIRRRRSELAPRRMPMPHKHRVVPPPVCATWRWHPAEPQCGAPFHYFSSSEAKSCLERIGWLAFVGDSTMEELAVSTLLLAGVPFNPSWAAPYKCGHEKWRLKHKHDPRIFDTGTSLETARVSMYWAASEQNCGSLVGALTFDNAAFRERFAAAHAPENATGRKPSALVFTSALHDMAKGSVSLPIYAAALGRALRYVANFTATNGSLVYKMTNTKTGDHACARVGRANAGNAAVSVFDAAAVPVLAQLEAGDALYGNRLLRLDEHALLLPLHEDWEIHAHHCANMLVKRADAVASACVAAVQALYNKLCPWVAEGAA